jgi:predicted hydrocarbon binding protein
MKTKFLKVSQSELTKIRQLYESVMSHACHGLFFREGEVYGEEITKISLQDRLRFFETARNLIKARGWADEIAFAENSAEAHGSIEVCKSDMATCHRMRGIIRNLYEAHLNTKVHCVEVECESTGAPRCLFKVERV